MWLNAMLFAAVIRHIGIPCHPVGQGTASLTGQQVHRPGSR
ncbi:hypothetical protein I546_2110 [Mycobacterium kansasii 732]|nr:hypothetical protein I546_2110 [Mycobacterium kansasii 732]